MSIKTAIALVLCDVAAHGLLAGSLIEDDAKLVKALADDGSVDPHKDAVAAGRAAGAAVVKSSVTLAAEVRAKAADALRVDLAKLEDLEKAEGADDATKAALAKQIAELRAQLDELLNG